jgi:hypothetical protein
MPGQSPPAPWRPIFGSSKSPWFLSTSAPCFSTRRQSSLPDREEAARRSASKSESRTSPRTCSQSSVLLSLCHWRCRSSLFLAGRRWAHRERCWGGNWTVRYLRVLRVRSTSTYTMRSGRFIGEEEFRLAGSHLPCLTSPSRKDHN